MKNQRLTRPRPVIAAYRDKARWEKLLIEHQGRVRTAAKAAGVSTSTFYYILRCAGIVLGAQKKIKACYLSKEEKEVFTLDWSAAPIAARWGWPYSVEVYGRKLTLEDI